MLNVILSILGFIPGLLTFLKGVGVNTGTVGTEALKIVNATETDIANYDAGQAVVVATLPASAVPGATQAGVLVAMQDGGPAYQALFG